MTMAGKISRLKALRISEVSLVERGANEHAAVELWKRDSGDVLMVPVTKASSLSALVNSYLSGSASAHDIIAKAHSAGLQKWHCSEALAALHAGIIQKADEPLAPADAWTVVLETELGKALTDLSRFLPGYRNRR